MMPIKLQLSRKLPTKYGNGEYYRMEDVKRLIDDTECVVRPANEHSAPFPSWNRYPDCPHIRRCRTTFCYGSVLIYVNPSVKTSLPLNIHYFRARRGAFIRTDSVTMGQLFEMEIIDPQLLVNCIETF